MAAASPPCRESGAAGAVARIAFRDVPLAVLLSIAVAAIMARNDWTAAAAPFPWLLSLVLVGLPHGAADLAIARSLAGRRRGSLVVAAAIYAAGMAAVALLFAMSPMLTIAAFSLLSIWHFGTGHLETEWREHPPLVARRPVHWLGRCVAAVARAGFVLGVPAVRWPAETAAVADRLVTLVHGGRVPDGLPFDPQAIRMGGWFFVAATALSLLVEIAGRNGRGRIWTLAEAALFGLLGFVADPLFSVGCYFLVWHAWRHMEPLMPLLVGSAPRDARGLLVAIVRIHEDALPLLLPTWAALAAAWWLLAPDHSARDLAILSIGVYLVVTPSHDVLVHRIPDA